jgi:hypothetical protein
MILDVSRGLALAEELGTGAPPEIQLFDEGSGLDLIEHLLHEAIHSLLLGLTPALYMDDAIAELLSAKEDHGTWDEARVLACEQLLFERLGIVAAECDFVHTAEIQGVKKAEYSCALHDASTIDLLARTITWATNVGLVSVKPVEPSFPQRNPMNHTISPVTLRSPCGVSSIEVPAGAEVTWVEGRPTMAWTTDGETQSRRVTIMTAVRALGKTAPDDDQLREWVRDGVAESVLGERVEPDGIDEHGSPSWLLAMGLL